MADWFALHAGSVDAIGADLLGFGEIVWINILLSGDNAVVIALACRGLPPNRRRLGMGLGASAAVVLRIGFTLVVTFLLAVPFLKLAAAAALVWVAVGLLRSGGDSVREIASTGRLWRAIRTIVVADAVMSLDNVLAIAAAAKGSAALLVAGLAVSVPLIVAGAGLVMQLLDRFPLLVWAGAGLLGWVAGEMAIGDPWVVRQVGVSRVELYDLPVSAFVAVLVLAIGFSARRLRRQ